MTGTFGQQLLERVTHLGLVNVDKVEGCSPAEMSELMIDQNVRQLPEIYRQFLLVMGRSSGGLFTGTDITVLLIFSLKSMLRKMIEGNIDARLNIPALANESVEMLPDDAFVFYTHQGYDFGYFRTATMEDDPPVYISLDGWGPHEQKWQSLSQFFESCVQEHIARRMR